MVTAIEVKKAFKVYGQIKAINEVDLNIKKSECFGILGPLGSGKSTIINVICALSSLTKGDAYVDGLSVKSNPQRIKSQLGILPQDNGLDFDFSVIDNLLLFSKYKGMQPKIALKEARQHLRFMHLEDFETRACDSLSSSQQRRLSFARALIGSPKILILDEPTYGLENHDKKTIWEAIEKIKGIGVTVLLATSQMDEAENLCDRIAILDTGKVLSIGSPKDLILDEIGQEVVEFNVDRKDIDYYLSKIKEDFEYQLLNNKVRLFIKNGQESKQAMKLLNSNRILIRKASLDDVFLKVAGHELKVEL